MLFTVDNRFHIHSTLGTGGVGVVYKVIDEKDGQFYAMKCLRPELMSEQEVCTRFEREIEAVKRLQHPNIVQIHHTGVDDEYGPYVVMELLEGEDLKAELKRRRRFPPGEAVRIVRDIASALSVAHAKGIIHRDLKPSNITILPDQMVKIMDFSIAAVIGVRGRITKKGQMLGSPGYMAPEQIEGRFIDHRVDIYALGVILYQLISGVPPFPGSNPLQILDLQRKGTFKPLSQHVENIPENLDALINRLLAVDPASRLPTSELLTEALSAVLNTLERQRQDDDLQTVPTQITNLKASRNLPIIALLLVTFGILLIVLGIFLYLILK